MPYPGTFHSSFYSFGGGSCDPSDWKSHFCQYDSKAWEAEGSGILRFSTKLSRHTLTIVHVLRGGFVLQLDCRDLKLANTLYCRYVVGDESGLTTFEHVGDELFYPSGCVVQPSIAWLALEDFLISPATPSPRVQWVDGDDIDWPPSTG